MLGKSKKEAEIIEEELPQEGADRISELEAEVSQANDMLLRRTAELENMRRRHEQERMQLIFEANKRLITELLSTVDDLERTLSFVKPEEHTPITEGIELVYKNFLKILERHQVQAIESVGKPFDHNLHDALMEQASDDVEPGTIITEVQKGYVMNDSVLRHSKVIVAKEKE
jgi:molecular chaperone GrpE